MNLSIDSINTGRYTALAAAKSVAGIGVPEFDIAHDRAFAVFLCVEHGHIRIMVGRAGAEKSAPGSMLTGYANPVRLTTFEIGVSGGELSKLNIEAAIMATAPTLTQPEITITSGRLVTTSLAVAHYFTKRHDDVLKRIKNLECSPEFIARNFAANEYTDSIGRSLPCYEITRSGFMFLVMGFTGKKAALLKENYINAFDAMEAQLSTPVVSGRSQVIMTFENGVVVDSRAVLPGEYTLSMQTFFELAERQGYLVIHPDDLKALSFGARRRGGG